ncbi:MAG: GNAT family N-acetyltransferase [Candidatus Synoicihabitans palmerolidicus]|nr:GNAT family N-acetyltransferase [Candidatus Synoicihabitans palmerolidicus]
MSEPHMRAATSDDLPFLKEVYIDAGESMGPESYTPNQVKAWAHWPNAEPAVFRQRVTAGHTWVVEMEGEIIAFAEFTPPDHLDFLYTRSAHCRCGFATMLHQRLEAIARDLGAPWLRTEASYISRPVCNQFGYRVTEIERVERWGETFTRFKMIKRLKLGPPATGPALPVNEEYEASFPVTPIAAAEEIVNFRQYDEKIPGGSAATTPAECPDTFLPSGLSSMSAITAPLLNAITQPSNLPSPSATLSMWCIP